MKNQLGNEENMAKVREAMLKQQSEEVRLGEALNEGVDIDYVSSEGVHYEGIIIFKRPSMKDYIKMGALKSEYLRRAGVVDLKLVDNTVKEMAQVVATLSVVITDRPKWLGNLEDVEDIDMLFHIYDKYDAWESDFRKTDKSESKGDSSTTK